MLTRRNVILFVSIIFILNFYIYSQSGLLMSIYGNVRDLNSDQSLPGITIYFVKIENDQITKGFYETSDSNGFYKVRYLEPGLYRFQIVLPELGNIYIGRIGTFINSSTISSVSSDDDYFIEIYEGKNVIFNVFLEETSFPNINRIDIKEKNTINFFMSYVNYSFENEKRILSKAMNENQNTNSSNVQGCSGLTINDVKEVPVSDTYKIIYNGNECVSLYTWQKIVDIGKDPDIPVGWRCNVEECKCEYRDIKGEFHPYIYHHSAKWIKDTWKNKKNIILSDDCASCLNQSYLEHERYHAKENITIVNEEFCNFKRILLESNISCSQDNHKDPVCWNFVEKQVNMMARMIGSRLSGTESNAWSEQEKHYDKNCKKKLCDNIPFSTIKK